jgi:phage terminase small subunit
VDFDPGDLTEMQRKFAEEYILDLNESAAGKRAGYTSGSAGHVTRKLPHVKAYIEYLFAERAKRLSIKTDDVLARLWSIATADVNELIQYRRHCCRHCYGAQHRYQWTDAEFERAVLEAKNRGYPKPEAPGGAGYDRTKNPNPDCPECMGQGTGEVFALDTRNASPEARQLYAGAKVGRDGLEIKIHDQMRALELVGKHIGMFKDKVEHSGEIKNTGPVLNLTLAAPPGTVLGAAQNPETPST